MAKQEIRLDTVGVIGAGEYAGWYVVVIPKQSPEYDVSYTIYVCTDTTFAFNPAERECYDHWMPNMPSVETLFEEDYLDVRWDENIAPPKVGPPSPEFQRLTERLRARMNKASKDKLLDDSGENPSE